MTILISCSTDDNKNTSNKLTQLLFEDSEQNKELIEQAKDTKNGQVYLKKYESEELNHHPDFKECAESRSKVGGRGGGNTFDYNLCILIT